MLGAHVHTYETPRGPVSGTSFAVWAPNARGVRVTGDFDYWDGRTHPDALARAARRVGDVRAGRRRGHPVQVPDPRPGRRVAGEGRPARVRHRDPAGDRVGGHERCTTSGGTPSGWRRGRSRPAARGADERLRGAPGLVAAGASATGRWPTSWSTYLAETGFTHVELLPVAEHPFGGVLGLPGHLVLRADCPVRLPGRLPLLRRPAAPGRHRRDRGLGARRTSRRTTGRSPGSTARRSTSTPTRAAVSSPTGARTSSTSAGARCATSWSPTRCTGWRSTTSTACGWTPSPRCSTSTTPAPRASGCRTSTAGGRTWTRSRSCRR